MLKYYLLCLWLITTTCFAQPQPKPISLKQKIDEIIAKTPEGVNIGVLITKANGQDIVYSKNAQRNFLPASNQKIMTALAGLLHLGRDYRFKTELLSNSNDIQQGTLMGDLIVRFGGDPTLKVEQLRALVNRLSQQGIKQVQGNIIIDNSIFGNQPIGPGWMWDDLNSCFSSPVTSNILNRNCVGFVVKPANTVNTPLNIESHQQGRLIFITNNTKTESNQRSCNVSVKFEPENKYILNGCLTLDSKPRPFSVPLNDPNEYLIHVMQDLMKVYAIPYSGKIIISDKSSGQYSLAQHQSAPLIEIIRELLKESDNLLSDAIFKTLGASYYGKPGTWKKGEKAVKAILQQNTGVDFKHTVIADGSGLSRYNLITPEKLVALLHYAYHNEKIRNDFYSSLPIAAIDGTLQNRMKQVKPSPKVHAKTGTMHGVSALSGYVETKSKQTFIFSIIYNGIPGKIRPYYNLEDKLCAEIAARG